MRAWAHLLKPSSWSVEAFQDLGASLLMLAAALIGLWLATGLGRRLRRDADGPQALALGVAAFAAAALITGLLQLWPVGLWLASAALAAVGWSRAPRSFPSLPQSWSDRAALAVVVWCGWHVLLQAWAPPAGWDATAYHLSIPRFYLEAGGVVKLPWLLHSHWPHLMETLYGLPLSFGVNPALIHAALAFALVAAVWPESPWAAAIVAAQPVFLEVAGEPHADGALALFVWLAAQSARRGETAWAGLFAGLALSCKLQGAAPAAALLGWTAWKRGAREAAVFALCAAGPSAPWLLHGGLYPFLDGAEPGKWMARISTWSFPRDLPLLARYEPYWMLPALVALRRPMPEAAQALVWPSAALFLLVFRYHEAWRFLLPALPMLALVVQRWKILVLPALLVTHGNELFAVSGARSSVLPGLSSREVYLSRRLPYYEFYRTVPKDAHVLLWRETRGFHLPARWRWGDPRLQTDVLYRTPESAHERMRELGITHILVNEGNPLYGPNPDYYDDRTLAVMEELLRRCALPERTQGALSLHRLRRACERRR